MHNAVVYFKESVSRVIVTLHKYFLQLQFSKNIFETLGELKESALFML
jgi:hypothetical protein